MRFAMIVLLLAACQGPATVDVAPIRCADGFERRDGACYEVAADDTGTEPDTADTADSGDDTATETGDTADTGDTVDTGRLDSDGDGVPDDIDCNDTDPRTYPGAVDDTMDGFDQDCDGADFDPCAVPFGTVEMESLSVTIEAGERGAAYMNGDATICSLECDSDWVFPIGFRDEGCEADGSPPPVPYAMTDETRACLLVREANAPDTARCDIYTSAGTVSVVVISGW